MPGVPPDALAQVKKGLKGLFSRKKRVRAQTEQEAPIAPSHAEYSSAGAEQGMQLSSGPSSNVPQILEPVNVEESRNIDLDPSSAHYLKSAPTDVSMDRESILPKLEPLEPRLPAEGMSATSGPLSDDLGYGGGMGSPVEDKQLELPSAEEATKLENNKGIEQETSAAIAPNTGEAHRHTEESAENALPAEPIN